MLLEAQIEVALYLGATRLLRLTSPQGVTNVTEDPSDRDRHAPPVY
jgi:hypothetical protein